MSNLIYPKNLDIALKWDYKFWNSQPVPKLNDKIFKDGQIDENIIYNNPEIAFTLPNEFEWKNYDMNNKEHRVEISDFLEKNYSDEMENEFRLYYSSKFLEWLYSRNFCIALGVIVKKNNLLVGF